MPTQSPVYLCHCNFNKTLVVQYLVYVLFLHIKFMFANYGYFGLPNHLHKSANDSCNVACLFRSVHFYCHFKRPHGIPPGPWCFPILGYLPNIAFYSRFYGESLPRILSRLSTKYGPIFSLYLGDELCVMLNSQEAVREAFMNRKLNDRPTATHFQNNEGKNNSSVGFFR